MDVEHVFALFRYVAKQVRHLCNREHRASVARWSGAAALFSVNEAVRVFPFHSRLPKR